LTFSKKSDRFERKIGLFYTKFNVFGEAFSRKKKSPGLEYVYFLYAISGLFTKQATCSGDIYVLWETEPSLEDRATQCVKQRFTAQVNFLGNSSIFLGEAQFSTEKLSFLPEQGHFVRAGQF
jgi:hypothetical protein